MQFSNTSSKDGIIQDCEFLCGLGDAFISGNATLLKQFTALINRGGDEVVSDIIMNEGEWEWDDTNQTTTPTGTQNLTNGTSDYLLPAGTIDNTVIRLVQVEIKDVAGNYYVLQNIDQTQLPETSLTTLFSTSGRPQYYQRFGKYLRILPAPDNGVTVTLTNGLRVTLERSQVEFASTDTTKNPGIPKIYHRLFSLYASEDYCSLYAPDRMPFIQDKRARLTARLGWGTANYNKDQRTRLTSVNQRISYE